ncbi:MAG: competence protein CoiA [Bacteroidales bacterium]|nr:competence protein CoiA [Bacteroidales bacterium]
MSDNLLLPYALKDGRLVHVSQIVRDEVGNCICPSCHSKLVLKDGLKRVKHFAHLGGTVCDNYGESIVHKLAKEVLLENKRISVPSYLISIDEVSNETTKSMMKSLRLKNLSIAEERTILFDGVVLEEPIENANKKPDACCANSDETIYVEILYTHAKTEEDIENYRKLDVSCVEINFSGFSLSMDDIDNKKQIQDIFDNSVYSKWISYSKIDYDYINKKLQEKIDKQEENKRLREFEELERRREQERKDAEYEFKLREWDNSIREARDREKNILKYFSFFYKEPLYNINTYGCLLLYVIKSNGFVRKLITEGLPKDFRLNYVIDVLNLQGQKSEFKRKNELQYCLEITNIIGLFSKAGSLNSSGNSGYLNICRRCKHFKAECEYCKNSYLFSGDNKYRGKADIVEDNGILYTSDFRELISVSSYVNVPKEQSLSIRKETIVVRKGAFKEYLEMHDNISIKLPEGLQVIDDEIFFSTRIKKNTPKKLRFIGYDWVSLEFWIKKSNLFLQEKEMFLAEVCLIKIQDFYADNIGDYIVGKQTYYDLAVLYFNIEEKKHPKKSEKILLFIKRNLNIVCDEALKIGNFVKFEMFFLMLLQEGDITCDYLYFVIEEVYHRLWDKTYDLKYLKKCIEYLELFIKKFPYDRRTPNAKVVLEDAKTVFNSRTN